RQASGVVGGESDREGNGGAGVEIHGERRQLRSREYGAGGGQAYARDRGCTGAGILNRERQVLGIPHGKRREDDGPGIRDRYRRARAVIREDELGTDTVGADGEGVVADAQPSSDGTGLSRRERQR